MRLNRLEMQYYNDISKGLHKQLSNTVKWLSSPEAGRLYKLREEEIKEYLEESEINRLWNDLAKTNAKDSEEFINRFYSNGSRLGYHDLNRLFEFTPADKEALFHLREYNYELIRNVNTDLVQGIRTSLIEGVATGQNPSVIANSISELPLTPVNGFSPQYRAFMIAATESNRAVNTGTLQAYCNYGVDMVDVITAGDDHVCDLCLSMEEMNPHPINSKDLPCYHPLCRCGVAAHISDVGLLPINPLSNPEIINLIPA